ncbi:MAG: hypothetical protein IJ156_02795 [Bacteroidales bacterium]|nr:hypothetical protein [Bacteroidales bacterium]
MNAYKLDESAPRCLECGDPIPYGRSDRKYCCDKCRHRWHNRETRRLHRRNARIIGILEKNYGILEHLLKIGVDSVLKTDLVQMGFTLDFLTSCRKVGRRMVCRCFDIRYEETESQVRNLSFDRFSLDGED